MSPTHHMERQDLRDLDRTRQPAGREARRLDRDQIAAPGLGRIAQVEGMAEELLDGIETATILGLRDRALIGLMGYTFARVGAAVAMRVEDYYIQGRRGWIRLLI